jgi:hypothetical protein
MSIGDISLCIFSPLLVLYHSTPIVIYIISDNAIFNGFSLE